MYKTKLFKAKLNFPLLSSNQHMHTNLQNKLPRKYMLYMYLSNNIKLINYDPSICGRKIKNYRQRKHFSLEK